MSVRTDSVVVTLQGQWHVLGDEVFEVVVLVVKTERRGMVEGIAQRLAGPDHVLCRFLVPELLGVEPTGQGAPRLGQDFGGLGSRKHSQCLESLILVLAGGRNAP